MTQTGEASEGRPNDLESSVTTVQATVEATQDDVALTEEGPLKDNEILRRLQEITAERERLLGVLSQSEGPRPSSRRRRRSHSSSGGSEGNDLEIRSIPTFSASFSFQRRDLWLSDLKRAFAGAPKHFRRPNKKILFAIDHMNEDCRQRWDQHLKESEEDQESLESDWSKFEEWNLSLLKDSRNRLPYLRKQLEAATQGETQSPWEFHHYLSSLEDKFARLSEEERAYQFYAKLRQDLRRHMDLYANPLPETRLLMVSTAQNFWEIIFKKDSKKRATEAPKNPTESPKKSRRSRRSKRTPTVALSS